MAYKIYNCPDCGGRLEVSDLLHLDHVIECEHCNQKMKHVDLIMLIDILDGAPRFELQIAFAVICVVGLLIALFAMTSK